MSDTKPDIQIYVSNRIDLRSEQIPNPLYRPMRCGAVFDPENASGLPGDDTGDNISERRSSFSEFTVQYWAWKNADADYIGLCHYRRFLSFSERRFRTDRYGMVHVRCLLPEEQRRFRLTDRERMESLISRYDAVTSCSADVTRLPVPGGGSARSVSRWWELQPGYVPPGSTQLLLRCIEAVRPDWLDAARAYLEGDRFRGNNCFVLKRELFDSLCSFEFPILFELERRLPEEYPDYAAGRCVGYFGEMLYGIFMHRLVREGSSRVLQLQLVYFADAGLLSKGTLFRKRLLVLGDRLLRPAAELLIPVGSRRRDAIKRMGTKLLDALRRKRRA